MNHDYNIIGIMSGTSLDGLDIAYCKFKFDQKWKFSIEKATTVKYSKEWKSNLSNAQNLNALDFISLHKEYGRYIASFVNELLIINQLQADYIASHGHTIFHQPEKNITFQLGDGACIAANTGITTISDFRNLDIALGGQGAPLVPVGDIKLFHEYDVYLNLGGFSNISYLSDNILIAYDICPVNIVLNYFAKTTGNEFDNEGELGRKGKIHPPLLKELNSLKYYQKNPPKSLAREWFELEFLEVIEKFDVSFRDKLRTIYEHIAFQIVTVFFKDQNKKVLVTGGGAYNSFLIELISSKTKNQIIIPDSKIIDYKEALIFAFLGLLRVRNEVNCISTVTGAKHDNIGGVIHRIG